MITILFSIGSPYFFLIINDTVHLFAELAKRKVQRRVIGWSSTACHDSHFPTGFRRERPRLHGESSLQGINREAAMRSTESFTSLHLIKLRQQRDGNSLRQDVMIFIRKKPGGDMEVKFKEYGRAEKGTSIAETLPRQRGGSGLTLADAFTCLYVTTSPTLRQRHASGVNDFR
jgi:hypothetical protein